MILRKFFFRKEKGQWGVFFKKKLCVCIDIKDIRSVLSPSAQMYPLIGVNLLCLLSQNRLSDFHTALETIDSDQLQTNKCIKQAVDLG